MLFRSGGQVVQSSVVPHAWEPSRGYQVTDDWWILGSDGKRLLMLPPLWQSPLPSDRIWDRRCVALLHDGAPEPVILELDDVS